MSVKKLLQVWGFAPKNESKRYSPEWRKQNDAALDDVVNNFGHDGTYENPTYPDAYWRLCQQRIEEMPEASRHDAYEYLLSAIANNHERGYGAPIYDEIQDHANAHAVKR